jgi:predicted amidohydrolase YtcJ
MAARLTAYLVVAIVGATLIAGLIVGAQREDNDGPVDLIVRNAAVYTADARGTVAEAVAVRGNQILRVGSDRDIARLQRPQTIVVDARGGSVLPGFNDAHLRLLPGAFALASADLAGIATTAELVDALSAWSAAHPSRDWVIGRGWTPDRGKTGVAPRQLLDAAVADRPVVVFNGDRSTVWVNSAALRRAGISARTKDVEGAAIGRDPRSGEPSGVLTGAAADSVTRLLPAPSREERIGALREAMAAANALGITSVQDTQDAPESFEVYSAMKRAGELTLRIYSAIAVAAPLTDAALAGLDRIRKEYPDDPLFKTGALAFVLDGPVETESAAMLEPYPGSAHAGEPAFNPDDLNRSARLADAAGWQLMTHATGDRAVRMALNAYAHAVRSNHPPAEGRRHRIERVAFVDQDDIPRFGTLGVAASMQPCTGAPEPEWLDLLVRRTGTDRVGRIFPFRGLSRETTLLFGSAWPDCGLNPMEGLHVAVTGTALKNPAEEAWQPDETVKLKAAIDAYTAAPAWASFDDQRKGTISPGMLADMVVFNEDLFTAPAERLAAASVSVTIFDGRIVYRRTAHPAAEAGPGAALQR